MKNLTFAKVFAAWFVFALAMMFINGATLQSPLLASAANATLGIFLLIVPIYPQGFKRHWDDKSSRMYIRIIAVMQIIISFATRVNF